MALNDLSVIGPQFTLKRRVAASATRIEPGEPTVTTATWTSGASDDNTVELPTADFSTADTSGATIIFTGISMQRAQPLDTGTIVAHSILTVSPTPNAGRLRGVATTVANVDTDTELLGFIGDFTLVNGDDTTGASDGGELFTIIETVTANTSFMTIADGNIVKGTLDVYVHPQAYRQIIA